MMTLMWEILVIVENVRALYSVFIIMYIVNLLYKTVYNVKKQANETQKV